MFFPLQLPPKFSPPDTFVYLLAFGLLAATAVLTPSAQSQQRPGSSTTASPSAEKVITVWKVGSPHSGDTPDTTVPPDLESSTEGLGYKLNIESFSAKGFAQSFFDAFANNQEPDILAVDNDGIINGITTPLGSFTGIRSNGKIRQSLMKVSESLKGLEGPRRGWEFLLQTSKSHEAAKALALRSPDCNASWHNLPLTADLRAIAVRIGSAYVAGAPSLDSFEDADVFFGATSHLHRCEESLFVGKVLEEEPFGDAGRVREFARGGAAESSFGEQTDGGIDDGSAALVGVEARFGDGGHVVSEY